MMAWMVLEATFEGMDSNDLSVPRLPLGAQGICMCSRCETSVPL